jgi:hypothetical protein
VITSSFSFVEDLVSNNPSVVQVVFATTPLFVCVEISRQMTINAKKKFHLYPRDFPDLNVSFWGGLNRYFCIGGA